jgi:FAD/FMN-containing dehydrogenase
MSGGSIGESIVMDVTRHMNQLRDVGRAHDGIHQGYAVVEPGMYYRDFEPETLKRGLQYPVYPASRELCALGGMVANNSAGERSLVYGQAVDFVRSVRAVMADGQEHEFGPLTMAELEVKMAQSSWEGELYRRLWALVRDNSEVIRAGTPRTSKNSSGYLLWRLWDGHTFNIAKLLCGSQGTLGIITQATLGLVEPKQHRRMVVVFLRDFDLLAQVVNLLLQHKPEALESFDDKTLSFTLRFLPDFVRIMGASNIISLGLRFLPEAWMALTGGFPKMILMAEFAADTEEEVLTTAQRAHEALRALGVKTRVITDKEETHKYWTIRRSSFNVIRSHSTGKRTTPFIDDIIVNPADMPTFLPKLYDILRPYHLALTVAGHAGNGNFHIIPLMDLRDPKIRTIIPEISEKVYNLVLQYRGSITAEHNDGLIRGAYVERQFGAPLYQLFREVKHLCDPHGIFNPGKKIDVNWQWALEHIRKD